VISCCCMTSRQKLGLAGVVVCGLGLALVLVLAEVRFSGGRQAESRVHGWNTRAIESTLAGVRVREVDAAHAAVVFFYDLDNMTDSDYQLSRGPNLVIMGRLRPNGSLSSDLQISLDSAAFVPASSRTRIALEMSHSFEWPAQRDAASERRIRQFLADQVAGLQGFVLFDQSSRYQIELATASPELQQAPVPTTQH
jgi:hypothetical protein